MTLCDIYLIHEMMSLEGLGPPTHMKKYEKLLDPVIQKAWTNHSSSWDAILKYDLINKLPKIDPKHIMVPGKVLDMKAKPDKVSFFKKMWEDINKLIKIPENEIDPVVTEKWFMYFFVTGFKDKEKATLYAQTNILNKLKQFGIYKGKTNLGTELTWRKEGLKIKLRLETRIILNKEFIQKMQKAFVNTRKVPI